MKDIWQIYLKIDFTLKLNFIVKINVFIVYVNRYNLGKNFCPVFSPCLLYADKLHTLYVLQIYTNCISNFPPPKITFDIVC